MFRHLQKKKKNLMKIFISWIFRANSALPILIIFATNFRISCPSAKFEGPGVQFQHFSNLHVPSYFLSNVNVSSTNATDFILGRGVFAPPPPPAFRKSWKAPAWIVLRNACCINDTNIPDCILSFELLDAQLSIVKVPR